MLYLSRITDATVDAFATCGFNVRMRKTAQCGPRLTVMTITIIHYYVTDRKIKQK